MGSFCISEEVLEKSTDDRFVIEHQAFDSTVLACER